MTIESEIDRDVYLDTDAWGEKFITSSGRIFNGIFDGSYEDEEGIQSKVPAITTKSSYVVSVLLVNNLIITRDSNSTIYKIREMRPDDTGFIVLILERQ